jgi:oligopeptide transport system substrate-binding protein
VELRSPTPYFLQCTAHTLYSPIHRLIDKQHPQWPYQYGENYPCNGSFQLKINNPDKGYQLIKNGFYWDVDRVSLEQVTINRMNATEAFQRFEKKEVDWIGNPFGGWNVSYHGSKEGKIVSFPDTWVCWCVFNANDYPFNHTKLRQAFSYAIQRDEIIVNPFFPLNSAYSILLPHYRKKLHSLFPKYDPNQAKILFNEALNELGITLEQFPPLTLIFGEKGIREHTALHLKKQFEECFGIVCHLQPYPWNTLFSKITKGNFQMSLFHWMPWFVDPFYTLTAFKSIDQELNVSKWENSEFHWLIEMSEGEMNPFRRSSYLLKAEEILSLEAPIIPLFYQPYQALVQKDFNVSCPIVGGGAMIAKSYYQKPNKGI